MPAGSRSEPLGWLAPLVAAPPAAIFGALIAQDRSSIAWSVVGAIVGAVLTALCGLWAMRERSPLRLLGRFIASATVAGSLGAPVTLLTLELALGDHDRSPAAFFPLGFTSAIGCVFGLAYGVGCGLVLALMLRLHRGPSRARRAVAIGGASWATTAVATLASSADRGTSGLLLLLLGCGVTMLVLSPLLRKKHEVSLCREREAPQVAGRSRGRLNAALLLGPGLAVGLVVLDRFIPRDMLPSGSIHLLAAGLAPALLAALVGAWSMRSARSPASVCLRGFVACTFAGAICAPSTYLVLVAATFGEVELDLRTFWLVSLFGGAIGVPTGLVLGVVFGGALAAVARLCRGVNARWIERASLGAAWLAAGGAAIVVHYLLGPSEALEWPSAMPMTSVVVTAAIVVMVAGLVLGGPAALRLVRAWRLLSAARRGERSDYAVVARDEIEDDEAIAALPAYLPFGRLDAVLVRTIDPARAPFRDAPLTELVALVPS